MDDFTLSIPRGARTTRKIRGRGTGSGRGGTCGKGHKGQKARSGSGTRLGFEGGQMPLYRRLPRRGFSNHRHKKRFWVLNVRDLERVFADGETVSPELLAERGLIRGTGRPVKILGDGVLAKKLTVIASVSATARTKIEDAGGTVVEADGATKPQKGTAEDAAGKESDGG